MNNLTSNYRKYTTKNPLFRVLNKRFLDAICDLTMEVGPKTILDAGCGEGFVTERIVKNFPLEIKGLDINEDSLALAQKKVPRVSFILGSVYALPFGNSSFDLVILSEVLEHLREPQKALAEIKRVTKKYSIISVPHEPLWRISNMIRVKYLTSLGDTPGHLNHWSKKNFIRMLSSYFKILKVKTPFPWVVALSEN